MADIDFAAKILNLKKKLQNAENQKIALQAQLDMAVKSLRDKYGLTPEEAEEEIKNLEEEIKEGKENIKKRIKRIEEKYDLG